MFALQLALLLGARFIGTSSSEAKRERLRALGADVVIDYAATPQWWQQVQQATGGHGADFVVETGGAATLEQSLKACARGGCVTLVGVLSGRPATADADLIQSLELTLRSIYVGPLRRCSTTSCRPSPAIGVRPVIDRSFGFGDAPAAFDHLRQARHVGKVVIEHEPAGGPRQEARQAIRRAGQAAGSPATAPATLGYTATAPANSEPKSAGTISTSRPGSGAWTIFPSPR